MFIASRLKNSRFIRKRRSVSGESHRDAYSSLATVELLSLSLESHRDAYSGTATDTTVSIEKLPGYIDGNILVKSFRYLYSKGAFSNYILPIMCVIGISVDPFFLFIPFVDDTKKCVGLDKRLGSTAGVIRSVFDLLYFRYIGHRTRRRVLLFIDLLAILPLPQVVILMVTPAMEGSKLLYTIQLLKLCVIFQFVPRFIAIYELVADKFDRATLARAAFNLFLFMLAGHVFGSFWYFFAIEREIECWKEACLSRTGCGQGSFYCDDNLGDYRVLNGFCPTKTRDTTIYDFGIFYDALQSGVVEATDFPQKFLHCFLWGLKTLSSFGSNLQLSGNGLESFFVILMIVVALVLFSLFIGNIQVYLQSEVVRFETLRSLKVQELEKQMSFEKNSKNLQKQSKTERSDGVALEKQMNSKDIQKQSKTERSEGVTFVEQRQKQIGELIKEQMEEVRFVEKPTKNLREQSKTERSEGVTLEEQTEEINQRREQLNEQLADIDKRAFNFLKQSKLERSERVTLEEQTLKQIEEQIEWWIGKQRSIKYRTKNLQEESKTERSEEVALAVQEIGEWIPFQKLSKDLQNQVMKYQQYIYQKTKDINMENLLNNLPKGITRNIKRQLCLELLKKVEEFKILRESALDELCDCLMPASYKKRTLIVQEGEPIYGMHFVLRGIVLRYALTSTGDMAKNVSWADCLVDGDFFGSELMTWARYKSSWLPPILSTFSFQTFTNVETFVLMADDLKNVLKQQDSCRYPLTERHLKK